MTYKEAAYILCDAMLDNPCGCDACPLASEEKDADGNAICKLNECKKEDYRLPMPVRVTASTKRCGRCNRQLSGKGNLHPERKYCPGCGQAIDWS